jgi:hypothetical protein
MSATLNGRGPIEVTVHTADYTLTANDSGTCHSSKGASGTITCTLPSAVVGLRFQFYVGAAQEHRIDPAASQVMQLPGTGAAQTGGAYLTANAVGETLEIACFETGVWSVVSSVGTWTAV